MSVKEQRFEAGSMDVIIFTGENKTPHVVIGSKGFNLDSKEQCFLIPNDQVSNVIKALKNVEKEIY